MKTLAAALSFVFVAGCAPALSPERSPREISARLPSVSPYQALRRSIDELLPDSLFPPSNAAVRIISLTQGETLYDLNGDLRSPPRPIKSSSRPPARSPHSDRRTSSARRSFLTRRLRRGSSSAAPATRSFRRRISIRSRPRYEPRRPRNPPGRSRETCRSLMTSPADQAGRGTTSPTPRLCSSPPSR